MINQNIFQKILLILIFISGISALIYELLWFRLLNNIFGISSFAATTVIAVFFLGLAFGGIIFGKISEKYTNVIKIYTFLELYIAISSIIGFFILTQLPAFTNFYHYTYNNYPFYALSIIRFILITLILLPSTIGMGGTIPLIVKYFIKSEKKFGTEFSKIYYINTAGGIIGLILIGFLLLQYIGVAASFSFAVILNIIIFIVLILILKICPHLEQKKLNDKKNKEKTTIKKDYFLIFIFMTGLLVTSYEILWVRILSVLGIAANFTFTIILIGVLSGIVTGTYFTKRYIDTKKAIYYYSILLSLTTLIGAIVLFALSNHLITLSSIFDELLTGFLISFIISCFLGALFPLGLRIYSQNIKQIGQKTGNAYFVNTIGGVLGSILTGFVFIPFIGIKNSVGIIVLLTLIMVLYLTIKLFKNKFIKLKSKTSIFTTIITIIIALLFVFSNNQIYYFQENDIEIVYYAEGLSSTVSVVDFEPHEGTVSRKLVIDRVRVASSETLALIDAKMLAHIPLILSDSPIKSCTVGFGTGVTSYSMLLHDIDVVAVEIEEKVIEASTHFQDINNNVIENPQLSIIIDDARNYLSCTNEKFDAIVSDVTCIKYKNNPSLYTVDYFKILKSKLTPKGIGAAWVPLNGLSFSDLKILIASFQKAFPHTTIWSYYKSYTHFIVIIGTQERLQIEINNTTNRIIPIQYDFTKMRINNEYEFLTMLLLGEEDVKNLSKNINLHTDNLPVLEFSDVWGYYFSTTLENNLKRLYSFQKEDLMKYFNGSSEQIELLQEQYSSKNQLLNI